MSIGREHIAAKAVRQEHLAVVPALIVPGSATAGTNIPLPDYAKPAKGILDALLVRHATVSAVHAACGASGAAYTSDTNIISPSGESVVTEAKKLSVVTGTPSSGQIALADDNNVVLGDDTHADDVLLLIVELK
ncbi:MAG: hypothetical protein DRJ18_00695 [Candidatus Methanomethylicota archaeon]|nr:MAG: hypothetical protein DRJ18_00695 [Candidatus Verstraetearchaeota archaeon]